MGLLEPEIRAGTRSPLAGAPGRGTRSASALNRSGGFRGDANLAGVQRASDRVLIASLDGTCQGVVRRGVLDPAQHGGLGGDPLAPDLTDIARFGGLFRCRRAEPSLTADRGI